MDVSVIIVNYNTFDLTENCIRSIYSRTKLSFEIILIDNASDQCNPNNFKQLFPEIKLIVNPSNIGFSKACNLGILNATGKYILLLNSDTELQNNAIDLAYEIIAADHSIGVLSGQLIYPDGRQQSVAGRFPGLKREIRELFRFNKLQTKEQSSRYFLAEQWNYNKPVEADWVWGAFFMFHMEDLNYFPDQKLHDNFFMYGEDLQWCFHFKKILKKKIIYSPLPIAIHYIGGSDTLNMDQEKKYVEKILPNEYTWMQMVHGSIYTFLFYFTKALLYYSLRKSKDLEKGKLFFRIAFRGLIRHKFYFI